MEIRFLGSGTSTGIPQIGCKCEVCSSTNPKDKRLRASIIIKTDNQSIMIDCGPDLRQQLIQSQITDISGILITHEHYDHIGGLDDVRPLGDTHIYAEKNVLSVIRRNMPYSFGDDKYPGVPVIHLHDISTQSFNINNTKIQPVRVMHAQLPILGYRIKNIAYLTDVKSIPANTFEQLQKLDLLIINALRIQPHQSHLSLQESLEIAGRIGAKQTIFTHMSHDMGLHDDIAKQLPENIRMAYDGLTIKL